MNLSPELKSSAIQRARELAQKECEKLGYKLSQSCLIQAGAFCHVMTKEFGIRTILQAGSCSWPRITPEMDDGVVNTHFSYVWQFKTVLDAVKSFRQNKVFPEIHIWAAIPERGEIVDLQTKYLPLLCKKLSGMEWLSPPPPDYLWVDEEHFPENVLYQPIQSAIEFAYLTWKSLPTRERS